VGRFNEKNRRVVVGMLNHFLMSHSESVLFFFRGHNGRLVRVLVLLHDLPQVTFAPAMLLAQETRHAARAGHALASRRGLAASQSASGEYQQTDARLYWR
jgi:hypothetical protein